MKKKLFFSVGPTKLFPSVNNHLSEILKEDLLSISHRSSTFKETIRATKDSLRLLNNIPTSFEIFFMSSATEVWERLMQNCVKETSYHLVNGMLSYEFMNTAKSLGKCVYHDEINLTQNFDVIFSSDKPCKSEVICLTHNESSIGMEIPVETIYSIRKSYPDKLIFVDFTSSYPCVDMDFTKIDSFFFSVQKGFGLPSGLGVWCINKKCISKAFFLKSQISIGSYHSVSKLLAYSKMNETPETPNMIGIYLLKKISDEMIARKNELLNRDITFKYNMMNEYIDSTLFFKPLIENKIFQSKNIICCEILNRKAAEIKWDLEKLNIIVSNGLPHYNKEYIRIGNYPAHSIDDYKILIEKMKTLHNNSGC